MQNYSIALSLVLTVLAAIVSADFVEKSETDYLQASEHCRVQEKVNPSYKTQFDNFQFPDEPVVHRFLRCVWVELELWNDRTGFNVEHIAQMYRDRANAEVLIPILTTCNGNARNDPPLKWCYTATTCILNSRVGQWFKDDVHKKLQNGHH